ncbi:MAG TPA: phage holin family protein, partial [Thermoflexales bacterium]|nr:phage holin family protein [Thermoflexales bacterium]
MKFLVRWGVLALAIAAAAYLVPGIHVAGEGTNLIVNLFIIGAIFGLVNAVIRPIIELLTCPLILLTLGLFTLIINAAMLMLTSNLAPGLLQVDGFSAALIGAVIIGVI